MIRLREKGCRVEGIGQEGKTGDDAKPVYDSFVDLRHGKARAAAKVATRVEPKLAVKRAPRGRAASAAAAPPAPLSPPLPQGVQDILDVVPQLRAGGWVELRTAAEPLRKAKLLGKTAASTKLFKKHAAQFALQSEKQPHQVRFLGTQGR